MKLEAVFRLHQFPYQSPIQCHRFDRSPDREKLIRTSVSIRILQVPIQNHTLTSGEAVVDMKLSRKLTGILIQCKRCDGHGNWSGYWNGFWHGHSVNVPLVILVLVSSEIYIPQIGAMNVWGWCHILLKMHKYHISSWHVIKNVSHLMFPSYWTISMCNKKGVHNKIKFIEGDPYMRENC